MNIRKLNQLPFFWRNYSTKKYDKIQKECKKFAETELKPIAGELDKTRKYPLEQIRKLGDMGYMGMMASSNFGGSGFDIRSASVAVEELSRGCPSTGVIVSIHNLLYVDFLSQNGNEYQKTSFLKPYTNGVPGAFALSEIDAGSDVANMSTTALKSENTYVLNGSKAWVTSAKEAEVAIVFATIDKNLKQKGITAFLVPLDSPGINISEQGKKLGIRATSTCDINLCDVSIPQENVIGQVGEGFKLGLQQLNKARIGIASQAIGIAQAALDVALEYAVCRRAFQKRLIDFQAVQLRIARMAVQIESARLLVRKAAKLADEGHHFIKNSAMAKLVSSEAATFSTHQCIQILGAMGYIDAMPAERLFRDARVTEIYGGVSDIQMLTIAEQLMNEYN